MDTVQRQCGMRAQLQRKVREKTRERERERERESEGVRESGGEGERERGERERGTDRRLRHNAGVQYAGNAGEISHRACRTCISAAWKRSTSCSAPASRRI
jgi:hypothetical protein